MLSALVATAFNLVFGMALAWVLVRYRFPGRRFVDALVDLPFALPTAVAGIALTTLFAENGWFGVGPCRKPASRSPTRRSASWSPWPSPACPSSSAPCSRCWRISTPRSRKRPRRSAAATVRSSCASILPLLAPALLAGLSLSFARSLGEFGAIIFIAGNQPMSTEITALLAFIRLEEYDYQAAAAIASVLLIAAFLMLAVTNILQARALRYTVRG